MSDRWEGESEELHIPPELGLIESGFASPSLLLATPILVVAAVPAALGRVMRGVGLAPDEAEAEAEADEDGTERN